MDASLAWTARGALPRLGAWLLRHPLALCLPVQAALLLTDLGRLPLWGDEHASIARAALPFGDLVEALQGNVHPTLYFLLLRAWLAFPCQTDSIVCARGLSALIVLAATVVIDRCWLARLDARTRAWFLALWTVSPVLLLYGRMARSYSLQLLLAALALDAGRRYAARHSPLGLLAYAAASIALLNTHYLPGIAVVAAVTLVMLWRVAQQPSARRAVATLAPLALIGLGFAGWIGALVAALGRVGGATPYRVLSAAWLDAGAALAYACIAFTVGESVHAWTLAALALLAPPIAVLVVLGARDRPPWLPFVAPAAVIAFLGAHHWVSYAFVAGRLLFLLPYYLLLLVGGGHAMPRLRAAVCTALLVLSLAGIHGYFNQTDFLNKAYVIPAPRISRVIADAPDSNSALVIVDHHSCNLSFATRDLGAATIDLVDQTSFDEIARIGPSHSGPVWFVRGTHDVSREGWNRRVEALFAPDFAIRRHQFAPYSTLDRWLMGVAGWSERPTHAVEVLEMHRRRND